MVRARDLGIPFDGKPGENNSITDVEGVQIGHSTIINGEGKLIKGQGPIRTGVTAILPTNNLNDEVLGAFYSYNGNGEMTGTHWIEESGRVQSPICITNTHSVGLVRDSIIAFKTKESTNKFQWFLPVVAETYDGVLNDINGFHVKREHVFDAIENAKTPNIIEGSVGGGTGMICHQFKGGIGTSSRLIKIKDETYTLGVIVQANYGSRENLTIAGVPIGKHLEDNTPKINGQKPKMDNGSIIVIAAINAPLLPYQLKRISKRIPAGLAKVGGYGFNSSGDIFLTFSTAHKFSGRDPDLHELKALDNNLLNPIFKGIAEATEEAIINAMIATEDMEGINGNTVYSIPHKRVQEILLAHNLKLKE